MILVTRFNDDLPQDRGSDLVIAINPNVIAEVWPEKFGRGNGAVIHLSTGRRLSVRESFDQVVGALRCAHDGVGVVRADECSREGFAS